MTLIHSLPEANAIFGLTILNDELFVYYQLNKKTISVYNKDTFDLLRTFSVRGLRGVTDMVSCQRYNCVYIADGINNVVHRVDNNENQITQWPATDEPNGLSVNTSCNVLLACHMAGKIKEFTTDGELLREISLESNITNPIHAVEFNSDQFAVCHGAPGDKFHRVSIVNGDGEILQSYGGVKGSGDGQLNTPVRLVVNGFILVSEINNHRVSLLSPSLKFVRQILAGSKSTFRMCFDDETGRLYAAECKWKNGKYVSGQVNVYSFSE